MHKIRLYGLVALPLAFGLAACSSSGDPEVSATPAVGDTANVAVTVDRPVDTVAQGQPAGVVNPPAADTLAVARDTAAAAADTAVSGYQASGAGMAQTFPVAEVNGSGYNGSVSLTDLGGGKTRVSFTLTAPDSVTNKEVDHDSHIHTGTCAAPGPVVHPLEDVRGNGTPSESEVSMSATALMVGNHLAAAHADNGEATIACADLKKSGM